MDTIFNSENVNSLYTLYNTIKCSPDKVSEMESWLYYKINEENDLLFLNEADTYAKKIIEYNSLYNKQYSFYILLNNCELPHYKRHRIRRDGHVYNPHSSILNFYQKNVFSELYKGCQTLNGEITLDVNVYINPPKNSSNKYKRLIELGMIKPVTSPDFDNYMKFICDAIQFDGAILGNDSQIVSGKLSKYYVVDNNPFVEISIKGRVQSWKEIRKLI